MLLVSAGHVYTAQQTAADVVAEELVAGGYARQLLTGFSVSVGPDLVARAQHDAVDFGILAGGASIGGAYIFDAAGSADASRELLIFIAFEGDTDGTSVIVQPSTPAIEIS
ncbi:MAG: hypothetical protein KC457_00925 [Myxococcales bacterium]|nr:hypothetical protein [Myxococcales bacterium]